nr:MAG TPA: hypothetical protein [Caudoviricetes sp.]
MPSWMVPMYRNLVSTKSTRQRRLWKPRWQTVINSWMRSRMLKATWIP